MKRWKWDHKSFDLLLAVYDFMIGLGWTERQNWEGNGHLLFHERKES
jgi:hypothetical protein